MHLGKVWLPLHLFAQNSQLFNDIIYRSISNVAHIDQEISEVHVDIHLHPSVKYDCEWANFHQGILYWISWKSDEQFSCWLYVMDRWMWSLCKVCISLILSHKPSMPNIILWEVQEINVCVCLCMVYSLLI